jgi:hypothetical protein
MVTVRRRRTAMWAEGDGEVRLADSDGAEDEGAVSGLGEAERGELVPELLVWGDEHYTGCSRRSVK